MLPDLVIVIQITSIGVGESKAAVDPKVMAAL